jgi:hypothetical protein
MPCSVLSWQLTAACELYCQLLQRSVPFELALLAAAAAAAAAAAWVLLLLLCSYLRDILQVVVHQVLLRLKCNLDSLQDTRSAQEHGITQLCFDAVT